MIKIFLQYQFTAKAVADAYLSIRYFLPNVNKFHSHLEDFAMSAEVCYVPLCFEFG